MQPVVADLYSVEQVADRLGLHVRTVRNYVRDGRLRAVRIGKQYRITQADLDALIGHPTVAAETQPVQQQRRVECSTVVHVDAVGPEEADRLANTLMAATTGHHEDEPLWVQTTYDKEQERMKVIVLGEPVASADVLRLIEALTRRDETE